MSKQGRTYRLRDEGVGESAYSRVTGTVSVWLSPEREQDRDRTHILVLSREHRQRLADLLRRWDEHEASLTEQSGQVT